MEKRRTYNTLKQILSLHGCYVYELELTLFPLFEFWEDDI